MKKLKKLDRRKVKRERNGLTRIERPVTPGMRNVAFDTIIERGFASSNLTFDIHDTTFTTSSGTVHVGGDPNWRRRVVGQSEPGRAGTRRAARDLGLDSIIHAENERLQALADAQQTRVARGTFPNRLQNEMSIDEEE